MELIHKILKKTKRNRTHPRRSATISHISEVKILYDLIGFFILISFQGNSTSGSIYLSVQIAIDPIGSVDSTREITRRGEFLEIEEIPSSEHSNS